jgi:hypothetical protein
MYLNKDLCSLFEYLRLGECSTPGWDLSFCNFRFKYEFSYYIAVKIHITVLQGLVHIVCIYIPLYIMSGLENRE